jgi:hypothetical protein
VRQLVQVIPDALQFVHEREGQGRVVGSDHDLAVLDETGAEP